MPWTKRLSAIPELGPAGVLRTLLLICGMALVSAPAQEKKLTVYAPGSSYSVSVFDREGRDYAGLIDILEPLGSAVAKLDGQKWKVRFRPAGRKGEIEAQFTVGKSNAKVRSKGVELGSRFLVENGRGLVPVRTLGITLAPFFDAPVEFHEAGRRVFIGSAVVRYTADFRKAPAQLVFSFSSPVNPTISTEPGRLRMVFTREGIIGMGEAAQPLDDRTITNVAFNEVNGAAELTVSGSVPLLASFSDGGKTITVAAAPQPAQAAPSRPPEVPAQPPVPAQAAAAPAGKPRFLIVIDPGHGGDDRGAALGDIPEKDFTLAFARRLRAELDGRGISALLLRDGDSAITLDQRALAANGAHAAVYIGVHAALSGTGIRVYTSDLPSWGKPGAILPWETAQSAYVDASDAVAAGITEELSRRQLTAMQAAAAVRPLNSVAAAAVAIEVSPPEGDIEKFTSTAYQQSVSSAIGSALSALRGRLEAAR